MDENVGGRGSQKQLRTKKDGNAEDEEMDEDKEEEYKEVCFHEKRSARVGFRERKRKQKGKETKQTKQTKQTGECRECRETAAESEEVSEDAKKAEENYST